MANNTVIPVRPEEVPKDLICAICLSVPLTPWIVRDCCHVFCRDCIHDAVHHQELDDRETSCPVCRSYITPDEDLCLLESESIITHRIWSNIPVKCEYHAAGCGWTGSVGDYADHVWSCPKNSENTGRDLEIKSLKEELQMLRSENEGLNFRLSIKADLETRVTSLERQLRDARSMHQKVCDDFSRDFSQLKRQVNTCIEVPIPNGRGGYAYNRSNVVPLAKLICQNLTEKPASINSNKIFECVRNISGDLNRDHSDNPQHYYIDVRMLLGICRASNWFTNNQQMRFVEMASKHGWN